MSVLSVSDKKAGVRNQGNRSRTEITANTNDKTSDRPDRYTDIAFVEDMERALFSIELKIYRSSTLIRPPCVKDKKTLFEKSDK